MNLAQILQADQHYQQVYFSQQDDNRIEIFKNEHYMWLNMNHVVQSAIELTPPYRPALPHSMVMLLPLIHDRVPSKVLELGGGAQSTQRYLNHSQKDVQFTSIESDSDVTKLVRDIFPGSNNLNIIEADAFEYLDLSVKDKQTYEWLIVDLFHGAESPINAKHKNFLQQVHLCLQGNGWLILNCLYPDADKRAGLVKQITQVFGHSPHMFAVPKMQNHILLIKKKEKFSFPSDIEQYNLI